MITKLTPEQKLLKGKVKSEWLNKLFSDEKLHFDKEKCREGVEFIYGLAKLKKPKVLFFKSPMALQYAANILPVVLKKSQKEVWKVVENEVWNEVWKEVWKVVENEVGKVVRNEVWKEVGKVVENEVGKVVRKVVRNEVGKVVENEVGKVVRELKLKCFNFSWYGSIWDYNWCSFYDFFTRIGVINNDKFNKFVSFLDSGIYDCIQFENYCLVSKKPIFIGRSTANKLHCEERAAIEFEDGYKQYWLHGVSFNKELWEKVISRKMDFKEVMSLTNIEQRMVALKMMDPELLLYGAKGEMIDKSARGNELWLIKDLFEEDAWMLKYTCPSTGRVYISGIDPQVASESKNADTCMAWKFSLTKEQYDNLKVEA